MSARFLDAHGAVWVVVPLRPSVRQCRVGARHARFNPLPGSPEGVEGEAAACYTQMVEAAPPAPAELRLLERFGFKDLQKARQHAFVAGFCAADRDADCEQALRAFRRWCATLGEDGYAPAS